MITSKIVYKFDPQTFLFAGEYNAQPSPLEPDLFDEGGKLIRAQVFIMPESSTEIQPPAFNQKQNARFHPDLSVWEIIPDFRGETWFEKNTWNPVQITEVGTPNSNLVNSIPKDAAFVISQGKKRADITNARISANLSNFPWAGKMIACDPASRLDIADIAGYVSLNNSLPPSFAGEWKATDNSMIPIPDVATFREMYQAMVEFGSANFARAQALKDEIANAKEPSDLDAIVW